MAQSPPEIGSPSPPARKYAIPRRLLEFHPRLEREEDHPGAWTFPAYLDDPRVAWLRELKALYESPLAFPASISPQAGWLLHGLVANLRPRVVVEVGAFLGASTLWMASALVETARGFTGAMYLESEEPGGGEAPAGAGTGVIHVFDDFGPVREGPWREAELDEDREAIVRACLERAGVGSIVHLHKGLSQATLPAARDALRAAGGVDLALLDGDHTIAGVWADLDALEPVLNTGGYVLLHDTYPEQCGEHQGPRHVIDHLNTRATGLYEKCELHLAPLNYGLAILRRIG